MKLQNLKYFFIGLCFILLIIECKKAKVDPNDRFLGYYQKDIFPKGYVDVENNTTAAVLRIHKTANDAIGITILASNKTDIEDGAILTYDKDIEFPNCKFENVDFTGDGINYAISAVKIVNKDKNVHDWCYIQEWKGGIVNGKPTTFYLLQLAFTVADTLGYSRAVYKIAD